MSTREPTERTTQRVILREPFVLELLGEKGIVLEIGTSGMKVEHATRLPLGAPLKIDLVGTQLKCVVRHSVVLPGDSGVLFHSGFEFVDMTPEQTSAVYDLLLDEAEEQVGEWEANLQGADSQRPSLGVKSHVIRRYLWLRFDGRNWTRILTSDPNQPLDGLAVPDDVSEEEITILCSTYAAGDETMRQYLRNCAMLSILERLRAVSNGNHATRV